MKNILLALTFLFLGCSTLAPIQKGIIRKTTIYAGRLIKYEHRVSVQVFLGGLRTNRYTTVVLTDSCFVDIKGYIEIPDSVLCYIRIEPCRRNVHRFIARRLEPWYFTWLGTNEEYRIIK